MKTATAIVLAFIALTSAALSQTRCVQNDPAAVRIGTMTTSVTFQSSTPYGETYKDSSFVGDTSQPEDSSSYGTKPKSSGVGIEVTVWRVNGQVIYSVDPRMLTFSGDGPTIDSMRTMDLFNLMAQVIIGQGLSNGYSTCTGTCRENLVKVSFPACVARVGSGVNTRFESCNPGECCVRTYAVCCSDGSNAPFIQLVGSSGSACSGSGPSGTNCESTCP
jgi:hypothetical protein